MGYQVGNICYATKKDAENVYFSLVVPIIHTQNNNVSGRYPISSVNQNAKLIKPEYINNRWVLNGQTIQANLPQCDIAQNFKDGSELGWYIAGMMASLWLFILIKKILR